MKGGGWREEERGRSREKEKKEEYEAENKCCIFFSKALQL